MIRRRSRTEVIEHMADKLTALADEHGINELHGYAISLRALNESADKTPVPGAWAFLVGNFAQSDEDLAVFNEALAEVQKAERLKAVNALRRQAEMYETIGSGSGATIIWHAIHLIAQEGDR